MHKRRDKRKITILFSLVAAVLVFFGVCESRLNPYIKNRSEIAAKSEAARVIGETVLEVFENFDNNYSDYATVIYDENGNVSSVEILSSKLTIMQSLLSSEIFNALSEFREEEISVSIGDISGLFFFFNRGLDVKVRVDSIGNVTCNAQSEFTQAGVNQTCHSIYFDISAEISVVFPFDSVTVSVNVRYLAAQTVIVGAVPQMFANV